MQHSRKRTMDDLGELRVLVAIVESGSLAAAGRRLGRSPPSITRILYDLERRVGTGLFDRSPRNCRATPTGIRLADHARQLLASYDEAIAQAAGEATVPRGKVRVTAPITFGREHVLPLITAFIDRHPEISFELVLVDRLVDLAEEEVDLGVRIGPSIDGTLITKTVGRLRHVFVATPAYLKTAGTPLRPDDLIDHDVVQHTSRGAEAPWVFRNDDGRPLSISLRSRFTVNDPDAAVATALTGRGVVAALSHQVEDELRRGGLVRILKDFEPASLPVNLVWPRSRRTVRRVSMLIDHLAQGLAALDVLHIDRCPP